jgi:Secretion system C-terminal sorting domain
MKKKLLLTIALFSTLQIFSQTDGWFLYTKPSTISAIVLDDTNANILHLATDIGYIQFNTTTGLVADFLNLTSQSPAIGHVNGLDVNPTNANIALALDDGFAIYDGTAVTIYNYDNSLLTVGSVGGTEFIKLRVRYGRQGELYIFKPDVTGYQVFNTGVFDTEVVTTIKPQDIVENQAGTKVYFAGWNDGLHELTKATTTWTNYTTANSDLIYNPLKSLHVDSNDLLYIGGSQGLNTMTGAGVWNTYQQLDPAFGIFFLPVYGISLNETNGDLLIQTSSPNSSSFGLSTLVLASNTWTNYTDDNTNCLNNNKFRASAIGGDGNIYSSKESFPANGSLFKFNHNTNTCSEPNINYLNAEVASSLNISGFNVRKKLSGMFDIGFTKSGDLNQFSIDPNTFSGVFPNVTVITPSIGQPAYSLLSDNEFFIVENNNGWVFIDDANNAAQFNHNLSDYLAITTQKAAAFDSDNGIINLVHKGFDASWNYRVYKTQCNTATGTCSIPEEIFTTTRDLTKNVFLSCSTKNDVITCFGVKTTPSAGKSAFRLGTGFGAQSISWNIQANDSPITGIDDLLTIVPDNKNPLILRDNEGKHTVGVLINSELYIRQNTLEDPVNASRKSHPGGGGDFNKHEEDEDNNGDPDNERTKDIYPGSMGNQIEGRPRTMPKSIITAGVNTGFALLPLGHYKMNNLLKVRFDAVLNSAINAMPKDIYVSDAMLSIYDILANRANSRQGDQTLAFIALLTNYGVLIKTGVDITNLILSTDDVSLKNTGLLLYPNPANDMVSFSNNSIKTITVYDINGRKVLSTENSASFSVKTLAQGVYIVKGISDNNVVVTKKLIVE